MIDSRYSLANGRIATALGARKRTHMQSVGVDDAFDVRWLLGVAVRKVEEVSAGEIRELRDRVVHFRVSLTGQAIAVVREDLGIDEQRTLAPDQISAANVFGCEHSQPLLIYVQDAKWDGRCFERPEYVRRNRYPSVTME